MKSGLKGEIHWFYNVLNESVFIDFFLLSIQNKSPQENWRRPHRKCLPPYFNRISRIKHIHFSMYCDWLMSNKLIQSSFPKLLQQHTEKPHYITNVVYLGQIKQLCKLETAPHWLNMLMWRHHNSAGFTWITLFRDDGQQQQRHVFVCSKLAGFTARNT